MGEHHGASHLRGDSNLQTLSSAVEEWSTNPEAHPLSRRRAKIEARVRTLLSDIVAACLEASSPSWRSSVGVALPSTVAASSGRKGEWRALLGALLHDFRKLLDVNIPPSGEGHATRIADNGSDSRSPSNRHLSPIRRRGVVSGSPVTEHPSTVEKDALLEVLKENASKLNDLVALLHAESELLSSEHDLVRAQELADMLPLQEQTAHRVLSCCWPRQPLAPNSHPHSGHTSSRCAAGCSDRRWQSFHAGGYM